MSDSVGDPGGVGDSGGRAERAPAPSCPRCSAPLVERDSAWHCEAHGAVPALWRAGASTYGGFVEHLTVAGEHPTYLPWPLGPGWHVSDHAYASGGPRAGGAAAATLSCSSGPTERDGPVDVLVVSEEPGVGLGARCAGLPDHDPGPAVRASRPAVRVRVDQQMVPLWAVSTSGVDADLDRSVLVGEARGRWLWLVLRPAPAILLLGEHWMLRDAASLGPTLVELGFGGPQPPW